MQYEKPRGLRAGQNHRSGESRPVRYFKHVGRSGPRNHPHGFYHHETEWKSARSQSSEAPVSFYGSRICPWILRNPPLSGNHCEAKCIAGHVCRIESRLAPAGPPTGPPTSSRRKIVISRSLSFLIRILIRFYQRILSPMLKFASGPTGGCRYTPSCSHYYLQAVELHGPFRGSWYGICRIFRCHPWGGSGYDPVPSPTSATAEKHSCACHRDSPHH